MLLQNILITTHVASSHCHFLFLCAFTYSIWYTRYGNTFSVRLMVSLLRYDIWPDSLRARIMEMVIKMSPRLKFVRYRILKLWKSRSLSELSLDILLSFRVFYYLECLAKKSTKRLRRKISNNFISTKTRDSSRTSFRTGCVYCWG